jgi:RsiW-degrading membrane proteinase PrsW (M82 family)
MVLLSLKLLFGLAPVAIFLVGLVALDSYKLVRVRWVLFAILAGGGGLLFCWLVHVPLQAALRLDLASFSRYVAPLTEEVVKALFLVFLIRTKRVGFMVDAAIFGFALGAGFGILENIFYLWIIPEAHLFTWLLRGCGTAVMHGSTGAVFAIVSHTWCERYQGAKLRYFLPGLGLVIVVHSGFNHFFLTPAMTTVTLVIGVPLVMFAVYQQSEAVLERWLGRTFDTDAAMLQAIRSGEVSGTRVGAYLLQLRKRFSAEVVADMFCLLRLNVELAIQAKGLLLMRKGGFEPPRPGGVEEKLQEMEYLKTSIGQTGMLALMPLLRRRRRDHWEEHLLQQV